jgi:hypothetical protein
VLLCGLSIGFRLRIGRSAVNGYKSRMTKTSANHSTNLKHLDSEPRSSESGLCVVAQGSSQDPVEGNACTFMGRPDWLSWLPFFLPCGVLLAVLGFSPNFQWLDAKPGEPLPFRENPFGGDFLQDWVGGKIASIPQERRLLYPSQYANQIQHSGLVGFAWPQEKYFPMVYPPYYYWLVSPFSYMPYRWSAIIWAVFSTALFVLAGWLLYLSHPPLRNHPWPFMFAMTAFVPWIIALNMGQKSTLLLLLFVGTYGLFAQGQKFLAGMVFGLVAIKPQLGIVIGLAMLLNYKSWSFVAGAAVTVIGLLVLAVCLDDGWIGHYQNVVRSMGDYTSTGGYQLHDSHSLVGGLKLALPSSLASWGYPLALVLGAAVVLLVTWFASFTSNSRSCLEQVALPFSNLVFATVLISPHLYTYDLTILLLPIVLVVSTIKGTPIENDSQQEGGNSRRVEQPTAAGIWARGLAVLLFVVSGMLPKLNLATSIPWGSLLILAIICALSLHLLQTRFGQEQQNAPVESGG